MVVVDRVVDPWKAFLKKLILELSLEGLIIISQTKKHKAEQKGKWRKAERHGTHGDL